jgi:pimeloyl-ACP methyl ester carboxylesterase
VTRTLLLLALAVSPATAAAQTALPELYYEVDGAGSPIVFVPDWAGDATTWFRVLPLFRDGHQLIRYDPRGQGRSEAPANGDYSIEAHGDDLLRVLDALGVERTDVVAAGLGCRIAIAAALEHPERFASLTLIEPHLAWTNEEASFWGRFLHGWDQSGRPSMGEYAAVLVGHWVDEFFMRREPWLVDFYDLLLRRQDPEELVASLRSWLAVDFGMPDGRNPVPILIVRGTHHGDVEPLGDPRIRAAFPYTRRVYISGSGGSPQLEAPEKVVAEVRARWAALAASDSL